MGDGRNRARLSDGNDGDPVSQVSPLPLCGICLRFVLTRCRSLMYHRAKPYYIHERIQKLGRSFDLRVLLVMNDVHDSQTDIRDLSRMALINDLTIVMAWTNEEAANYIEMYKLFEKKPPDAIRGRPRVEYAQQIEMLLTSVDKVNKTDVVTLTSHLGSLDSIVRTPADTLACLTGFGPAKVRNLREAFHQPFRVGETRTMRQRRAQEAHTTAERVEEPTSPWDGSRIGAASAISDAMPPASDSSDSPNTPSHLGISGPPGTSGTSWPSARTAPTHPPPPPPQRARDESPLPSNPSLRAAVAFRRAGKTSLAPKRAFGASTAPTENEAPGAKRARDEQNSEEYQAQDGGPVAVAKAPPVSGSQPEPGDEDELDLELRDLENLDEAAQLELALKLSGASTGDRNGGVMGSEPVVPLSPPSQPETQEKAPHFSPEPDIDLGLEDFDDLTEEEQLAIAMQLSQQGL